MATPSINDARAFRDFLNEKLTPGSDPLPLDEALGLWEYEHQTEVEREATLRAIRRGFADVAAGRVRPAREALDELRRKYRLPPLS